MTNRGKQREGGRNRFYMNGWVLGQKMEIYCLLSSDSISLLLSLSCPVLWQFACGTFNLPQKSTAHNCQSVIDLQKQSFSAMFKVQPDKLTGSGKYHTSPYWLHKTI